MPYMPRRRLIAYLQALQTRVNTVLANKQTLNFRFVRRSHEQLIALVKVINVEYPGTFDLDEITRFAGKDLVKFAQALDAEVTIQIAKSSQSTASTASSVSSVSSQSDRSTASTASSNSSSSSRSLSSASSQSSRSDVSTASTASSASSRSSQSLSSQSLSSQSTASSASSQTVSSAST